MGTTNAKFIITGVDNTFGDPVVSKFRAGGGEIRVTGGELLVADGGRIEDAGGALFGGANGTPALARVEGVNEIGQSRSTFEATDFNVGSDSGGQFEILAGGLATASERVTIGDYTGDTGVITVSGVNAINDTQSELVSGLGASIGFEGTGILHVADGGLFRGLSTLEVGGLNGGNGIINVSGIHSASGKASTVQIDDSLDVLLGNGGNGTINLSDGGVFESSNISMAIESDATGTINIGTGNLGGTLNVATITGGSGDATVNFNHTDDIDFAPRMTGTIKVNQISTGATTLTVASVLIAVEN